MTTKIFVARDCEDVTISTASDGDVLMYQGTSAKWVNSALIILKTDTLNELTTGSGVTVDGVLMKDGGVTLAGEGITIPLTVSGNALETNKEIRINSTSTSGADCFGVKRNDGNLLCFATDTPTSTQNNFQMFVSGQMRWGDGATTPDTTLYRAAAGAMRIDSTLGVGKTPSNGFALEVAGGVQTTGGSQIYGAGLDVNFSLSNSGTSGRNWVLYSSDNQYPAVLGTGCLTIYDGAVGARAAFTPGGSLLVGTLTDGMTTNGSLAVAQDLAHRGAKAGFYNKVPIAQQVLATGAGRTVDDVITALQALGLVKQS